MVEVIYQTLYLETHILHIFTHYSHTRKTLCSDQLECVTIETKIRNVIQSYRIHTYTCTHTIHNTHRFGDLVVIDSKDEQNWLAQQVDRPDQPMQNVSI